MSLQKIGIAGMGAIGRAVAKALKDGIHGCTLTAISEIQDMQDFDVPNLDFVSLADQCDLIIECLPPHCVPDLCDAVFSKSKDMIVISSSALLLYPDIIEKHALSTGRIIVPSGALIGLDGVNALKNLGVESAKIVSTKPPMGFSGAPHVDKNGIDLGAITTRQRLFQGNAIEAAAAFPANVNVAATLALASIGAEKVRVEVWADPKIKGNQHEIIVESAFSKMQAVVQNKPDPDNPKTSILAAQSIITVLKGLHDPFVVL